jgi:putative transposase
VARLARFAVPGLPHHVTQRGNRRQKIFFEDGDYGLYRYLFAERCRKAELPNYAELRGLTVTPYYFPN